MGNLAGLDSSRAMANSMLEKFGALAILRRASGDRPCIAAIISFSPMERMGKMANPLDRKALVSALAPDGSVLTPEPDMTQDHLITFVKDSSPPVQRDNLRIVEPPGRVDFDGEVLFWRLTVRR